MKYLAVLVVGVALSFQVLAARVRNAGSFIYE